MPNSDNILSIEHLEFIRLVANGINQSEAYRATVGNPMATIDAVKSKASNLAAKYASEIAEMKKNHQQLIQHAHETEASQNAQNEVLENAAKIITQFQADAKVFRILGEDDMVDDMIIVGSKYSPIKRKPTQKEIQDAYKLYNLRFGSNAAFNLNVSSADQPLFPE
jgi:hypothetical protein